MKTRKMRSLFGLLLLGAFVFVPNPVSATPTHGKIAGVVVDDDGTPQMGATVSIEPEQVHGSQTPEVFTDARGRFSSLPLAMGLYSVHVTLAGFLPALEQHVDVNRLGTTVLRLRLDTAFAPLQRSHSRPAAAREDDDWAWVLRGASATRPILRWTDGEVVVDNQESSTARTNRKPHGEVSLSAGNYQPGLVTNFSDAPTTGFAYSIDLGASGELAMAGAFSYFKQVPAGGFSTLWVQDSPAGDKTVTGIVLRQSELGPNGPGFRGMKLNRESQISFSNRISLRYSGELVLADLDHVTSSLRPDVELEVQPSRNWHANFTVASEPWEQTAMDSGDSALQSALDSLNAFPALLEKNNQPILARSWHEEAGVERKLGNSSSILAAVFHDQTGDAAVFGEGSLTGANVLPDYFANGFAYDAGGSGSWGARIAFRQSFRKNTSAEFVYSYAGALAPTSMTTSGELTSLLATKYRQGIGGRVSSKAPFTKTKVSAGYTWLSGPVASRPDPYGSAILGTAPYLNISVRQPLPAFFQGHMVLVADVNNLLGQGYVSVSTKDGEVLLIPAYRTFQGGLSFLF